jgi:hypothetical protein
MVLPDKTIAGRYHYWFYRLSIALATLVFWGAVFASNVKKETKEMRSNDGHVAIKKEYGHAPSPSRPPLPQMPMTIAATSLRRIQILQGVGSGDSDASV